jgi:hypothetical protein
VIGFVALLISVLFLLDVCRPTLGWSFWMECIMNEQVSVHAVDCALSVLQQCIQSRIKTM